MRTAHHFKSETEEDGRRRYGGRVRGGKNNYWADLPPMGS